MTKGDAALLSRARYEAAKASINKDLQKSSKLRKISLTRLEKEVEKLVNSGQPVPPDMKYLAGMTKISHVFFYPETKDIVIAGPAEGYFINADNRVVGMKSGVATLQLQDLIVALRCFDAEGIKRRSSHAQSIRPRKALPTSATPTPGSRKVETSVAAWKTKLLMLTSSRSACSRSPSTVFRRKQTLPALWLKQTTK